MEEEGEWGIEDTQSKWKHILYYLYMQIIWEQQEEQKKLLGWYLSTYILL